MNSKDLVDLEVSLLDACYKDDLELVKNILEENPNINLNFEHYISKSGGNGTPLILTGKKEIAELLIKNGANINYKSTLNDGITALDSAINTRDTKTGYKKGEKNHQQILELISYFESLNAKRGNEL